MRTLLVTGGSTGIGAAIAEDAACAKLCDRIIIHYNDHKREAESLCDAIRSNGIDAIALQANFVHADEIDTLMDTVQEVIGEDKLHGVVHAAAINVFKPLSLVRVNQWDFCMAASTRSFMQICGRAKKMLASDASIVAISSLGSERALPHYGPMGPLKAALDAIVRQIAYEFGPMGVRVNAISPGLVNTTSIVRFPMFDALLEHVIERTPLKHGVPRIADPVDIAPVASFLLSANARWITGQTIVVDGGFTLT